MENFDAAATLEAINASMIQLIETGEAFHITLNLPDDCAIDIQGKLLIDKTAQMYEYMLNSKQCLASRCDLQTATARFWPWVESAFTEDQMVFLLCGMEQNNEPNFALVDDNRLYVQGREVLLGFIWHPHHVE